MPLTFRDGELRQILRQHVETTQPELLVNEQDQLLTYPAWLGEGYKRDIRLPSGIDLTLHHYRLHQDLVNACSAEQSSCCEFIFRMSCRQELSRGWGLAWVCFMSGRAREIWITRFKFLATPAPMLPSSITGIIFGLG